MSSLLCCLYAFTELAMLVPHDNPLPMDRPSVVNPYATLGLGWDYSTRRTVTYIQVTHTSGARIGDQGDDAIRVGTRVYFGRRDE